MTFERAIRIVMDLEGGYVLDEHDPGGATKFGISKRQYPNLDIEAMTEEDAREIYFRDYWQFCRCSSFTNGMDLMVLDAAVNQGPSAAIRMLQAELNVEQDGVFGPITAAAYQRQSVPLGRYAARRMLTYGLNPQFTRYGLGWSRRLMHVFMAAVSLS